MAPLPDPERDHLRAMLSPRELQHLERVYVAAPTSSDELRDRVARHVAAITAASHTNEFLDVSLGREIASVLRALIELTDDLDHDGRSLVAAAVNYFTDTHDPANDLSSAIGLEDDARVVNAVATVVGASHLSVCIPD